MPGAPEHPVTLGDLRVNLHMTNAPDQGQISNRLTRPATVADLVSALRAEGVRVELVERIADEIAIAIYNNRLDLIDEWSRDKSRRLAYRILDALAEAQPFPPAGGVS